MGLEKRIYSVLIISAAEKFNTALAALLPESNYSPVRTVSSISSAKQITAEYTFDLSSAGRCGHPVRYRHLTSAGYRRPVFSPVGTPRRDLRQSSGTRCFYTSETHRKALDHHGAELARQRPGTAEKI